MMVKTLQKKKQSTNLFTKNCTIYLQKKKKKKKKLVFLPACRPPSHSIHVLFSEIEIKRQLREKFSTDQDRILTFRTVDNNLH